ASCGETPGHGLRAPCAGETPNGAPLNGESCGETPCGETPYGELGQTPEPIGGSSAAACLQTPGFDLEEYFGGGGAVRFDPARGDITDDEARKHHEGNQLPVLKWVDEADGEGLEIRAEAGRNFADTPARRWDSDTDGKNKDGEQAGGGRLWDNNKTQREEGAGGEAPAFRSLAALAADDAPADSFKEVVDIVGEVVSHPKWLQLLRAIGFEWDMEEASKILDRNLVEAADLAEGVHAEKIVHGGDFLNREALNFTKKSDGTMRSLYELIKRRGLKPVKFSKRLDALEEPSAFLYFGPHLYKPGGMTKAATELPNVFKMVNHMLATEAKRAGLPLKYTHFGLLWNCKTHVHSDGKNAGPSYLIAAGDYEGGMYVEYDPAARDSEHKSVVKTKNGKGITWPRQEGEGPGSRHHLPEGARVFGRGTDVRYKLAYKSGQPPHWTGDFTGERFLVVAWVDRACKVLPGT
ncbi:unnamed protein product, partial [Amoebophrya sp. A25]